MASGYWPLFRFNPQLKRQGKNPFQLDSKISKTVEEFIGNENRFLRLVRENPERAKQLHPELIEYIAKRFNALQKRAEEHDK